jgi:hypothetical protein
MRALFAIALFATVCVSCIKQAQQAIAPTPEGAGAFSCREIVENCDRSCSDPLCLNNCTGQGTADAAAQHAALLDCAQRNSCMDEDCMREKCPQEIETCMGPTPTEPPAEQPTSEPSATDGTPTH